MNDILIRNAVIEKKMLDILKSRGVIPSKGDFARRAIREKAVKFGITEEFCLSELAKEAQA